MDEIKELTPDQFSLIIAEQGFEPELLAKDYYITLLLYLLKDIGGMYFKGGTALQKTLLGYSRISEDIDFTLERSLDAVKKEIIKKIKNTKLFGRITQDKDVEGFTRFIVTYNTGLGKGIIFIDLNERARLLMEPKNKKLNHFYPNIPSFSFPCLSQKEMVAEKIAAAIGRNKPRDHYDIYQIIKHNIPIDMSLVKKKCKQSEVEPNILKMFNKAKKLHKRWNEDMMPLLTREISYEEVMTTLAEYFNLKEEKEKLKEN